MIKLVVLPGDGIGPEVTEQALEILNVVAEKYDLNIVKEKGLLGGAAIRESGEPFPQATRNLVAASDAVFLGAVGDPQFDHPESKVRPEMGLLALRKFWGYMPICGLLNVGAIN